MTRYYVPIILVLEAETEQAADVEAIAALETMQPGPHVEGYILPDGSKASPASADWLDLDQVLIDGCVEEVKA